MVGHPDLVFLRARGGELGSIRVYFSLVLTTIVTSSHRPISLRLCALPAPLASTHLVATVPCGADVTSTRPEASRTRLGAWHEEVVPVPPVEVLTHRRILEVKITQDNAMAVY